MSKTFSMTGWRVGFAVGNATFVAGLGKVKTNMDSGVFQGIQEAAIAALEGGERDSARNIAAIYKERRDLMVTALRGLGLGLRSPQGHFLYLGGSTQRIHFSIVQRACIKGSGRRGNAGLRFWQ